MIRVPHFKAYGQLDNAEFEFVRKMNHVSVSLSATALRDRMAISS